MIGSTVAGTFADGCEDAGLGNAAEVILDRGLPACLRHVEIDGTGETVGFVQTLPDAMLGDRRAVRLLVERIDAQRRAMGEQRRLFGAVQGDEPIPEGVLVLRHALLPGLAALQDGARRRRILQARRLKGEVGAANRDRHGRAVRAEAGEDVPAELVQDGKEGDRRIVCHLVT